MQEEGADVRKGLEATVMAAEGATRTLFGHCDGGQGVLGQCG